MRALRQLRPSISSTAATLTTAWVHASRSMTLRYTLRCRGLVSLDAEACRRSFGGEGTGVPVFAPQAHLDPRFKAFLIGAASGLVEPVAALICAWLVNVVELLLPLGLACAAGAMLLVVTQEIIPESRSNGHHRLASLGLCTGFCLMMVMDTAMS